MKTASFIMFYLTEIAQLNQPPCFSRSAAWMLTGKTNRLGSTGSLLTRQSTNDIISTDLMILDHVWMNLNQLNWNLDEFGAWKFPRPKKHTGRWNEKSRP